MTHPLLRWPVLILAAVALTLATVVVGSSNSGFGFPLPWKTGGCPPPGISLTRACLIAVGFDWIRFALDALLYTVLAFAVLLGIIRYRSRRVSSLTDK